MFGYAGLWPSLDDVSPTDDEIALARAKMDASRVRLAKIKLAPMKCDRCDFINEYVGKEHLTPSGLYICRPCRQNPYR